MSSIGIVMNPWMPPVEDAAHGDHARRLERVGVGDAFVTKWIVAGDDDDRGRQSLQVGM